MKNALAIVTLSSLLAACAGTPPKQSEPAPPLSAPTAVSGAQAVLAAAIAATPDVPPKPPVEDPLPQVALSEELMFKLLTAEIAFQRGEWQAAYVTTLVVAQQTRDPRLARRAAEIAISVRQNGEALAAIRLWHELAPHSEEAAQYLLGFLVLTDELDAAQPMFAQRLAESRQPARGLMLLQIQRMLLRARDKGAAFGLLERLTEPYMSMAEAHIALAQGAFLNNDSPRAVNEARQALTLAPSSELAVLTYAQVAPDKMDAAKALTSFIATHPNSREVRLAHARLQIDQRQYAKARAEFEALLKQQPEDLSALYALGVLASQSNDPKAAEKYLTLYIKTLADNPDDERDPTQALLLLAQIAEEAKDIPRALNWLSQVDPGPAYISAQVKRAQLTARQGDLEGALTLVRETKAENEQDQTQLVIGEASLLRDGGRLLEAMTVMQAGLQKQPNDPDLLYDFAMITEKAGMYDLMETTLRKLMLVAPNNQHAYNALGYSLAERNVRLPEALKLIETALSITPDDPFILDSLGWVQYRLGKLKEAEEALRRAFGMRQDAEIAVHLGEVLWMKGQKAEAEKLWREARGRDPQNESLRNTLVRLQVSL